MSSTISSFAKAVYEITGRVPKGKVTSYKIIARVLGKPNASRAVGQALRRNPYAPTVPCHRVIATNFSLGGFFGPSAKNLEKKIQLLTDEGILFEGSEIKRCPEYRKTILFDKFTLD